MNKKILFLFVGIIFLISFCSAEHIISGIVEDALDGTSANGHTIILWNPLVGDYDNLTDIINETGDYSFDCELLQDNCSAGDVLNIRVLNNGDDYISEEKNITLSEGKLDLVEDITLNSPPEIFMNSPVSFSNFSYQQINFNCSATDLDENLRKIYLYGNWTGEWELNETIETEQYAVFTKNISEGVYEYECVAEDSLSIFSVNSIKNIFTIDLTPPNINFVYANVSSAVKNSLIKVNCSANDLLNIESVIIQAITPSLVTNYSTIKSGSEIYYTEIFLNEIGGWNFNCIVNDSAGNINNLLSEEINVFSNFPELYVNSSKIELNENFPIENQEVFINAIVENLGAQNAENILIGFFEGDPNDSGILIENKIINVSGISFVSVNVSWNARIGNTNIFVVADYDNTIEEENESNNKANRLFSINSWQEIYGNTTVDKIIGGNDIEIKKWFNQSFLEGNIFVADSESIIDWLSLIAIGKTKNGENSSEDFSEIDSILGMDLFEDSVSNCFSNDQIPKKTQNIVVYQREISGIPIINSTNNSNFITGILWDSSDDNDGEFDFYEKEDLVFVSPIKKSSEGSYGVYDYEIKIPSKLREYHTEDSQEVYLYYNLN
jgi:hypothetical protein